MNFYIHELLNKVCVCGVGGVPHTPWGGEAAVLLPHIPMGRTWKAKKWKKYEI